MGSKENTSGVKADQVKCNLRPIKDDFSCFWKGNGNFSSDIRLNLTNPPLRVIGMLDEVTRRKEVVNVVHGSLCRGQDHVL